MLVISNEFSNECKEYGQKIWDILKKCCKGDRFNKGVLVYLHKKIEYFSNLYPYPDYRAYMIRLVGCTNRL